MIYQGVTDDPSLYKIVFVCTGNTCRSPMAEAIAKRWISENLPRHAGGISVSSAGLMTRDGFRASDGAIRACDADGLTLEAHRSREFTQRRAQGALVVAMTESHRSAARLTAPTATCVTLSGWADGSTVDIADPYMSSDTAYQACFSQIKTFVHAGLARMFRTPQ